MVHNDAFLIGFQPIDDTHAEFVGLIQALRGVESAGVQAALADLEAHCVSHFEQEKWLMVKSGYPSQDCHSQEHEAVLASVREVRQWCRAKIDVATARRLGDALAGWFETHTAYLDSALCHWLVKQRHGGAPVVVRRMAASTAARG